MLSKKCIKRNEDLVNNKDETDIEYITNALTILKVYMKVFVVLAMLKYKKKQLIIQLLLKLLNG